MRIYLHICLFMCVATSAWRRSMLSLIRTTYTTNNAYLANSSAKLQSTHNPRMSATVICILFQALHFARKQTKWVRLIAKLTLDACARPPTSLNSLFYRHLMNIY